MSDLVRMDDVVDGEIEALAERGYAHVVDTSADSGLWWLTEKRYRSPNLARRLLSLFRR